MIMTYTEQWLDLFNLEEKHIRIEDIAHHLACFNRFNGAVRRPINVAHHSVYVLRRVRQRLPSNTPSWRRWEIEMQALLHDGSEAYLGDVTKWLKMSPVFEEYRKLEDTVQSLIYRTFDLPEHQYEEVDEADRFMVRYEYYRGYGSDNYIRLPGTEGTPHPKYPRPTPEEVASVKYWRPWGWAHAEQQFLAEFNNLVKRKAA